MSNGHASTNCVVVMGFNGILFPLTNPLHYVNPFFLENGTIAIENGTIFLPKRLPFLRATVGV